MNFSNIMFLADEAAPQQGGMPSWVLWVILGVAFVLMIVMTIVPRKKQQKQTENMMNNLKVGDKVMTIGRIVGEIIAIDNSNNTVTIKSGVGDTASTLVIDKLDIGMVLNQSGQPAAPKKEEEKKDEKEAAPVVEKTAKESKVADQIKKQKKGAFDDAIETNAKEEVKAEEVVEETPVATEEVKAEELADEVVEEAKVEDVKEVAEKVEK